MEVRLKAKKPSVHKHKESREALPMYYYAAGVAGALVVCYIVYKGQQWQRGAS